MQKKLSKTLLNKLQVYIEQYRVYSQYFLADIYNINVV